MTKINNAFNQLIKSLETIADELPKQIDIANKNLTDEDFLKIKEALNTIDFENRMKQFKESTSDLKTFIKEY